MEKLEELRKIAQENNELEKELNEIRADSQEEVIQKVIAAAKKYGLDLEKSDFDLDQELVLEDLEQVAGGDNSFYNDKKRGRRETPGIFT